MAIDRHPNDKDQIASKTTEKIIEDNNLKGYNHIFELQCFKNESGETIIDFFDLNNLTAANDAYTVVDNYYCHTLKNPSHQTKQFKIEYVEHFDAFTSSNNEPYTTANTAATTSKNQDHQICVRNLTQGLQPLSKIIDNYFKNTYPSLYDKMKILDLGPNVPKSFGIFPTVAINYNAICAFHWDPNDHPNSLCVVCPLGLFEGGQLVFPELKLIIHIKQGQAIAFRSHFLVHGNSPVITGNRHSVVFFVHGSVIKQNRPFNTLFFGDLDLDGNHHRIKANSKKDYSSKNNSKKVSKNSRRDSLGKYYNYI